MKYRNDWHLMKNADVVAALGTDMYKGLSEREAAGRRKKYGANSIWHVKRMSAFAAVCDSLFDIATLLLIVSAAAAALFDRSGAALAVTVILILGGILRSVVYIRANRILENMAEGFIPVASVIRDGRMKLLSAREIVPGDMLFLEAGSTVPCDGRVLAGEDSVVSERGITENHTPVHKFDVVIDTDAKSGEVPCECRSNMLFAGSVVLSGNLRIAATACGRYSLIGMKQEGIEIEPSGKLPLIEKLEGWCKFTSLVMLACVMGITILSLFCRDGFTLPDIFLTTLAMSVAAMSEYLTVIGYIIIAVSVRRCAGREEEPKQTASAARTQIRRPSELERLANVGRIVFCGSSFFESGSAEIHAYRTSGSYYDRSSGTGDGQGLNEMVALAIPAVAAGASGRSLSSGITEKISDRARVVRTAAALCSDMSGGGKRADRNYPVLDHVDSANVFSAGLDTSLIAYEDSVLAVSCGGIAEVLRVCTGYQGADGVQPLDTEMRRKIFTECAKLEYIGAKIVAVAKVPSEYTTLSRLAVIVQNMTFVGYFAVSEQPEAGMEESLAYIRENKIIPILLSSEPERDLYYCHDIGLMNKKTKVVPYTELQESDLRELSESGMIVSFPEMKYGIPASMKSEVMKKIMAGEKENRPVTAAVGHEVSDLDVLRQADIGFASASSPYRPVPEPLSRSAAAVVRPLSGTGRGGLGGILRSFRIARQAVRNIKAAAFYMTSAQVARLAVILSAVLLPQVPLLDEVSILVWGLLFDFAAVLVMAFEHDDDVPRDVMEKTGKFIPISIRKAVGAGLGWGLSAPALVFVLKLLRPVFRLRFDAGADITLLAGTLLLCGLVMASECMKRGSLFRHVRINYAFFGFALMTVVLVPLILLTPFGAAWVGGKPCGLYALLALIPASVMLAVWEIVKAVQRKKRGKKE